MEKKSFPFGADSVELYPPKDVHRKRSLRDHGRAIAELAAEFGKKIGIAAMLLGISHTALEKHEPKFSPSRPKAGTAASVDDLVSQTLVNYLDAQINIDPARPKSTLDIPTNGDFSLRMHTFKQDLQKQPILSREDVEYVTRNILDDIEDILGAKAVPDESFFEEKDGEVSIVLVKPGDKITYTINDDSSEIVDDGAVRRIQLNYQDMHLGQVAINNDGTFLYTPLHFGETLLLHNEEELKQALKEMADYYDAVNISKVPAAFLPPEERPTDEEIQSARATLENNTVFIKSI
ncbi:hypothetical protein H6758_01960 [Candidatus Nomurabacteria bacterium]|nr:hypothetical protein [Candidatus Nomurabacteria bacterium]